MVVMADRPAGVLSGIPPLPPFVTPQEMLADALPLLDPPSRITVTDAAERFMRVPVAGVWQAFDRETVPYTVEPADVTQSRRFQAVCFVGPSQSGKSKMLETVALHPVMCEPDPVQVIHMTKQDAEAWVEEKLDQTIWNSPAIRDRLGRSRDDSTLSRKRFRGMRIAIGYPTPQQLSSRTQRMVLLTDYDHMPQRLGPKDSPEGSPFMMARQRVKTYMSRGCVLVESTPAFPVADETWRPDPAAPHAFPPVTAGIVQIYNEGTRARWYWECPDCAGLFEPRFDRLTWDATLDPGAAGETARMVCPHCGSLIEHRHKVTLNRAALRGHGGWRHETDDGSLCGVEDAALRRTEIASYALDGAAAVFASWAQIVTAWETAKRKADALGDEADLAVVTYTQIGRPWLARAGSGEGELSLADLRDRMLADAEKGTAPGWTRFVTVSVDVQATRFAVQVTAWGAEGLRTLVDRFDMIAPPGGETGRALDPAGRPGDWDVLAALEDADWPVAGQAHRLRAVALSVDFQGGPGVSDNAERFWRARRRAAGPGGARWYLTRGRGGFDLPRRVWEEAPDAASKGRRARSIRLLNMATDRLKDTIAAALLRGAGAAGAYPLPRWLEEAHLAEFVAERRGPKGWVMRPGAVRNESTDLSVMAQAVAEHLGMPAIDWTNPPAWALAGPGNARAVLPPGVRAERNAAAAVAGDAPDPAPKPEPARIDPRGAEWIPDRGDWI